MPQTAPPAVNLPAGHAVQSVEAVFPAIDDVPAAQLAQLEEPVFAWYVPAAQSVQLDTDPLEIFPASQLVQAEAEAAEYLPSGQAAVTAASPPVAQYDPAVQPPQEPWPAEA